MVVDFPVFSRHELKDRPPQTLSWRAGFRVLPLRPSVSQDTLDAGTPPSPPPELVCHLKHTQTHTHVNLTSLFITETPT